MIRPLGNWAYDPGKRLGCGGYAEVFACHGRDAAGAPVHGALKILKDPTYANTLEREVAALDAIRGCPHTPALLDYGRDAAGRLCIVTSLAHGQSLEKALHDTGAMSLATTYTLIRQLLATLAFAHQRGWLHKDLKASNLLRDGDDFTLLDWGIAAPVGDGRAEAIRSKNQDAVAPEAYFGRHGIASDFYQLGLLACHALTGAMPYHLADERNRDYRVAAHCLERPQLPAIADARLHALLGNWLDKDPRRRIIAYDLNALLEMTPPQPPDFSGTRDYRQLSSEGYLQGAARADIPYAMHEWGERLSQLGRMEEAIFWFGRAATQGYARSMLRLADILTTSKLAAEDKDRGRADALLHAAAESGMARAQYRWGERLLHIDNGLPDVALRWLRRAAEQGERGAQYRLARLLEKAAAPPEEVARWYASAAERGHRKAQARLAECLERGWGLACDPETAIIWRARSEVTA